MSSTTPDGSETRTVRRVRLLKHVNEAGGRSRLAKSPVGLSKFLAVMIVALFVASAFAVTAYQVKSAGASEQFLGYNSQTATWDNSNLGKAYNEGDFVSYQLMIQSSSKIWGHDFGISYDFFQASSGAVYVDGFDTSVGTGFQYTSTNTFLPNGQSIPPAGWGTHIPTPAAGESWTSGPKITNYTNAFPQGTSDGTPPGSAPDSNRYFNVTALPWSSFTSGYVILFFRAHLALTIIWQNALESVLPQALDGNQFQTWTNAWEGSSFATGSSRHFQLQYPGVGAKTIPIPIAAYPSSMISGHKYVAGALFNGWQITLNGLLDLGSGLPAIPFNPPAVLTGSGTFASGAPWPTGYFEFTGLVQGNYTVTEENRAGYGHVNIIVSGNATNVVINIPAGTASLALPRSAAAVVDFYNRASSTTTTQLSASSITLGQSVTDTATVSGAGVSPTGTVQFLVKEGAGSFVVFDTKTLNANGQATSGSYVPLSVGSYWFKAEYSGDSNYQPSVSADDAEPLTVNPATPTVSTLLSATSITLGGSVTDTVTVTGLGSPFPAPTGTVMFQVSSNAGATWTTFSTKTLDANGQATSDSYVPLAAGSYLFRAIYSGDNNYNAAQSGNTAEPLSVGPATPEVTTQLSQTTITLGDSVTDTATVTGLGGQFPAPTGTVQFQVQVGIGPWTNLGSAVTLVGGSATSIAYMPLAAGSYHFRAIYSGDSNYLGAQSGDAAEPLTVEKFTPTVTTLLSATTITLGGSVTDTVTVTGLPSPIPGPTGTVQFEVSADGGATWTLFSTQSLVNGQATSSSYTPLAAGSYLFRALYLGDSNYNPAQSGDQSEPLSVGPATPTVTTQLSQTSITLGESITDTATVTGLGSPFPMPTGTVQFWVKIGAGSFTLFSTKTLDASGIAVSDAYTPLTAGSYFFKAVYLGDSNYVGSASGDNDEPLTVGPATPTVTTQLSASTIGLGGTVTDLATVTGLGGQFPTPTGTVQFWVKIGAGAWTLFSTKTLDANGQATSDPYEPLTVDTYHFKAVYSGDSNYVGAQSGENDEPLNVTKPVPTVVTQLSMSDIVLGGSVTDLVTVTGLPSPFPMPTGTVQFYVQIGVGPFTLFSTKTLDANGQATSDSYTPLTAGSYHFQAVYLGDSNYMGAQSAADSEPLTVEKFTPTVTTLLSATSITLGGSITDTVTVTGLLSPFPMPTGTVQFEVSSNGGATWTLFSTKSLDANGQATSDSYTPLSAGSYLFRALYLGDSNYNPAQSGDFAEPLTVGPASPAVSTLLSESVITLGGSITDMVTVTGLGGSFPMPTGVVAFQVSTDGAATWTTFSTKSLDANGQATSDSYTPLAAGSYLFRAVYAGDNNYLPAMSGDNAEPLIVNPATPTVTTLLSQTTITLGDSVTDTATVTGLGGLFPMPTGTVDFYVMVGAGPWTLFSTKTLVNGQATSDPYTPAAAGSYHFKAVYLGDSNYVGAQSGEDSEPLTVEKFTPTVTTLLSESTITLGDSVTDTVTVTGLPSPFPGPSGTVQFEVSADGGATWTLFSTKTLDANGQATSDSYMPLAAGSYLFRALYLGDSNYNAAQSADDAEPLAVQPFTPTVTTLLSASSITLGESVTDTVMVTGLPSPFPAPSGTVQFQVSTDGGSTWTTFSTKTLDASGSAVSDPYTPAAGGTYLFRAVYSGDTNYGTAQSGNTAEPLTVTSLMTRTVGYWKNHQNKWVGINPKAPFPWTTGRAAGMTYIQILNLAPKGDATIILAYQYIAAKLNANAFGAPQSVLDEIAHAEYLFSHGYPVGSNPPPSNPVRAEIINLAAELDAYNNSGEF